MQSSFLNLNIAMCILLTMPVTNVQPQQAGLLQTEINFKKANLRTTMTQKGFVLWRYYQ